MCKNVCRADRAIRIIVGLALLSLAFVGPKNPWFFLGLIPLITGLVGYCPLYSLVCRGSCAKKSG